MICAGFAGIAHVSGQIQDWEQIQQVWALQRMDAEKKNPAALP